MGCRNAGCSSSLPAPPPPPSLSSAVDGRLAVFGHWPMHALLRAVQLSFRVDLLRGKEMGSSLRLANDAKPKQFTYDAGFFLLRNR